MKRNLLVATLAVIFGLACPTPEAAASAPPDADQLITQLERELKSNPRLTPASATAIRTALAQQRYAEVQQYIGNIAASARDNPQITATTEQLALLVQAQALKAAQNREATADKIIADATALFFKNAPTSGYDDCLVQLAKLGVVQNYGDPSSQKVELARQFVVKCQDYTGAKAAGNAEMANSVLREMTDLATRIPNVPRSQLIALQSNNPRNQDDPTYLTLGAKLSELLDTAKGPADFDALIKELALASTPDRYTPNQRKIEALRRITKKWQDYFAAVAANDATAGRALTELLNDTEADALYPRSKVLRLVHGQTDHPLLKPEQVNFATLDEFCTQLRSIPSDASITETRTNIGALKGAANQLAEARNQLKAGNPQPVLSLNQLHMYQTGEYAPAFDQIQQALLLDAVTQLLNTPDVKPDKKSTLQMYLDQVMVSARDHKDWSLAQRVLDAQAFVPSDQRNLADNRCYTALFTAQNLVKAGDWTNAIRYYQAAARNPSAHAPVAEVAAQLQVLKEAHPKEFEEAQKLPALETMMYRPLQYPPNSSLPIQLPGERRP